MISGEDEFNLSDNNKLPEIQDLQLDDDLGDPVPSKLVLNAINDEALPSIIPDAPKINIIIEQYERRGEGINAYIVYKIVTKTENVLGYSNKESAVWRRFSDFLGLHEKIHEKYFRKGVLVPDAPEKSLAALTKTKIVNQNADESGTNEFAERRARLLQRFCMRIARHPKLVSDCDFRDFLTIPAALPKAHNTAALSSAGVLRMFKNMSDVLNKMAYHMDENDRWFEIAQQQLDEMEQTLMKFLRAVESLVSYRRELASSTESFSKSLSMLASCEENTGLARALSYLSETHENIAQVHSSQAEKDLSELSEVIQEQLCIIYTIKTLFFERVKIWQNWQTAQQNLTKKREIKARFELNGRTDKVNSLKDELTAAERQVDDAEREFSEVSKNIRAEYERYTAERKVDFTLMFSNFIECLIEAQKSLLTQWEKFAPEARTIVIP